MKRESVVAMIPARIGSTRLRMKNLALLNGKPLISYAIEAAKEAKVFSRVIVNSDNQIFAKIAERYNVEFYLRDSELGSSTTKSDAVVYDFIKKIPADIIAWVNPTSPLQTGREIRSIIQYFMKNDLDTLITVKDKQVHCIYDGKPINFSLHTLFAQTQELRPVRAFVYSVMMWRTKVFSETFERNGFAMFCGNTEYFPVSKESAIIIKRKEDIMLAEYIIKSKESQDEFQVTYDELVNDLSQ